MPGVRGRVWAPGKLRQRSWGREGGGDVVLKRGGGCRFLSVLLGLGANHPWWERGAGQVVDGLC